jgi:AcrR family transcriptional regulator
LRRGEILDALLRIAGSRGLHAASMRTVAASAGVTVSTVQYYFHTKEQLLYAGLQHLADAVHRRAVEEPALVSNRHRVRAWLVQMIPADDEQRLTYTVFAAYHALALTDPELAGLPYGNRASGLEQALSTYLRAAQLAGELTPDTDPHAEAANLLALATGLGNGVMGNLRTATEATHLLDYQLDRLFAKPATARKPSRDRRRS